MGMEVLEVNTPGELVMWLHLAGSEVSMEQGEAEIILDYLAEHNMALAVRNQELVVKDGGEEVPEYKPYSIDDAIRDVCEWNMELIGDMEDGMKNPDNQAEYNQFSEAHDILKKQETVLDGLYMQTKYEKVIEDCAIQIIMDTFGELPDGVQEKLESYRQEGIRQSQKAAGQLMGGRSETEHQGRTPGIQGQEPERVR